MIRMVGFYPVAYAYARGYYDGRANGTEDNTFLLPEEREAYSIGYQTGVADYCMEAHPEDVETL